MSSGKSSSGGGDKTTKEIAGKTQDDAGKGTDAPSLGKENAEIQGDKNAEPGTKAKRKAECGLIRKTDAEWRKSRPKMQYMVTRHKAT